MGNCANKPLTNDAAAPAPEPTPDTAGVAEVKDRDFVLDETKTEEKPIESEAAASEPAKETAAVTSTSETPVERSKQVAEPTKAEEVGTGSTKEIVEDKKVDTIKTEKAVEAPQVSEKKVDTQKPEEKKVEQVEKIPDEKKPEEVKKPAEEKKPEEKKPEVK